MPERGHRHGLLCLAGLSTLLAAAAGLGACGDSDRPVAVTRVHENASGIWSVEVASCHGKPTVAVEESPTEVRLRATAHRDDDGDCGDLVSLMLAGHVAGRRVVDARSGQPVTVCPPLGGCPLSPSTTTTIK